jgi:hypothetical protein
MPVAPSKTTFARFCPSLTAAHTRASAMTICYTRGTAFQSTGEGKLGTRLLCRTYSTHCRTRKTSGLPSGATSRRAGNGCAGVLTRRASSPLQARDPKRRISWCRSQPNLFSHG